MRTLIPVLALALALPASLRAQHEQHHPSPYAGQELSEIPSLTQQELDELRAGAGMGFAKAAELNHYPGPRHALELAAELGLTTEQRDRIEAVREEMLAEAIRLGEVIIDRERTLNRRFRHQHIDVESLRSLTAEIATLYGELRHAHLAAHITTRALLTEAQIAEYDRLRGYEAR